MPDIRHTTNSMTHGKYGISRSESSHSKTVHTVSRASRPEYAVLLLESVRFSRRSHSWIDGLEYWIMGHMVQVGKATAALASYNKLLSLQPAAPPSVRGRC